LSSAIVLQRGEGERHVAGNGEVLIKATAADTANSCFLAETKIHPGFPGPPLHRHEKLHDMFYVLEGTLTMQLGDDTRPLQPGTFVCVPPGVPHTFRNDSEAPVRFLNFNTPGGWENYMRDLGRAAKEAPLTQQRIGEIASRYDFEAL
jgi:quercetin dioxygenase-like cupin family protein